MLVLSGLSCYSRGVADLNGGGVPSGIEICGVVGTSSQQVAVEDALGRVMLLRGTVWGTRTPARGHPSHPHHPRPYHDYDPTPPLDAYRWAFYLYP